MFALSDGAEVVEMPAKLWDPGGFEEGVVMGHAVEEVESVPDGVAPMWSGCVGATGAAVGVFGWQVVNDAAFDEVIVEAFVAAPLRVGVADGEADAEEAKRGTLRESVEPKLSLDGVAEVGVGQVSVPAAVFATV